MTAIQTHGHEASTSLGAVLVVGSGACFGLAVLFAKGAFAEGANVQGMLIARFAMAAVAFWAIVAIRRPAWPSARVVLTCVGLGAVGYAMQSGLYFGAVAHLDAGLAALLLYTYPALVTLLGFTLGRESLTRRKLTALGSSAAGLLLLLGLGGVETATPLGVALALGAALTYAVYILVASTVPADTDIFLVMAILCTGALASLFTFTQLAGTRREFGHGTTGLAWIVVFTLVGTLFALVLHQRGLKRVGPSKTAILSCVEPVFAAGSVALAFGERLTMAQVLGGAAVLAGVVILQAPALPHHWAESAHGWASWRPGSGPVAWMTRKWRAVAHRHASPSAAWTSQPD